MRNKTMPEQDFYGLDGFGFFSIIETIVEWILSQLLEQSAHFLLS